MPLSLASSGLGRCRACGFEGQPDQGVQERLRAAAALLRGLDVRERQLDASQTAAVHRALAQRSKLRLAAGLISVFPIGWSLLWLAMFLADEDGPGAFTILPVILLPLAVYLIGVKLALGRATRARERLLAACAADPPEHPQGEASCHVCGAPLASRGADAITRCAYCEADNVVHPQALAAAKKLREAAVLDAEKLVEREARTATFASVGAGVSTVLLLVASPFIGFGLAIAFWFALGLGMAIAEPAPYPHRYVFVVGEQGRCIGRVAHRKGQGEQIRMGTPKGQSARVWVPLSRAAGDVKLAELTGKKMRLLFGQEGVARSFWGDITEGTNRVDLDSKQSGPVEGACLLEERKP